ncbi:MAG: hypothetical protein E5V74_09520 [Mesorhizobium sp.]|nr:MAG: hypothetical protein E5W03_02960 [Mesorhizobium sp.]TIV24671.1 MAG: hypothetical protein E5W02_02430 [Mesorhizobium sp.]TIV64760.1 MAG: hypothetical protein E5V86_14325 [Mesorhizobium sp.]TIW03296.1 MAG: hypothetical protein E5V74_09520 [Mesorhizobium sp.]
MMQSYLVATVGLLFCAAGANAADNTVHDRNNWVSLTVPKEWTSEPPSGYAMLLDVKSTDDEGLSCMVSGSLYDPAAKGSPSDPRKFIEDWSMETWKRMMGKSFNTADFSNDRLARFPDGYPVRLADLDFTVSNQNNILHGHSRIAFSVRGGRYGYVNCSLIAGSEEEVALRWAPLAKKIERVVNSFVLDPP